MFLEAGSGMFELVWGEEPSRKTLRRLTEVVVEHRVELLEEWETKVQP